MRDVVIIGGGLSGLAAAWELETLKVPYTLIEVKARLGGAISSERAEGFTLDGGVMLHGAASQSADEWDFLEQLGLQDAVYRVEQRFEGLPHTRQWLGFKGGTGVLIDALQQRISPTTPVILRMAVSSLGFLNGQDARDGYAICMENGMVLDAKTLIVAAPARYAERMFYTLQADVAARLLMVHYDTLTRISLGYRQQDITLPLLLPVDIAVAYVMHTTHADRVPEGGLLLQIGIRHNGDPARLIQAVVDDLRLPPPLVSRAHYWAESDVLHQHEQPSLAAQLEPLLPRGIALIGSDYSAHPRAASIPQRVKEARAAARRIAALLQA